MKEGLPKLVPVVVLPKRCLPVRESTFVKLVASKPKEMLILF